MNNYQSIKIAIVISTFNKDVSDGLLKGAANKFDEFSNNKNLKNNLYKTVSTLA